MSITHSFGMPKICPVCKKNFLVYDFDTHAYRIYKNNNRILVCSWGCVRAHEKKYQGKYMRDKKEKIQRQLQGLPDID